MVWQVSGPADLKQFALHKCGGVVDERTGLIDVETSPLVYEKLTQEYGLPLANIDIAVQQQYQQRRDRRAKLQAAVLNTSNIPEYPGLRAYQNSGIRFIMAGQRVAVLDGTGMGKTRQAAIAATLATRGKKLGRILVVCLKSARIGWEREWKAYVDRDIPIIIPRGGHEERLSALRNLPTHCVVIVNWQMLSPATSHTRKEVKTRLEIQAEAWKKTLLAKGLWQVLIADEVHCAKDHHSRQSERLFEIAQKTPYVIGLSATPTDGKAHEWFGVLRVLDPWRFTSYTRFFNMFVEWVWSADGRYQQVVKNNGANGAKNLAVLDDVLKDYCIGRKPGPDSGIPPIRYKSIFVEMEEAQQRAYDEMKRLYRITLEGGGELHAPNTLAQEMRLRQVLLHPALIGASGESAKVDALIDYLQGIDNDHNLVVYCSLIHSIGSTDAAMLNIIKRRIETELHGKFSPRLLYADSSEAERADIETWLGGERNGRIALVSSRAGGTSLNLQGADIGIRMDRPWSFTLDTQALGRLPRLGQKSPFVVYVDLIVANSLDERVHALLDSKQEFSEGRFRELMAHYIQTGGA